MRQDKGVLEGGEKELSLTELEEGKETEKDGRHLVATQLARHWRSHRVCKREREIGLGNVTRIACPLNAHEKIPRKM